MVLLFVLILFNSLSSNDATNNNNIHANPCTVEFENAACLAFITKCPIEIKQEIYKHYLNSNAEYSKALKKYYLIGDFKYEPPYEILLDSPFIPHAQCRNNKAHHTRFVYKDRRFLGSVVENSCTPLNNQHYFAMHDTIIHLELKTDSIKKDHTLRVPEITGTKHSKSTIHPFENLLLNVNGGDNVITKKPYCVSVYSWNTTSVKKDYSFELNWPLSLSIIKPFFVPFSTTQLIVISECSVCRYNHDSNTYGKREDFNVLHLYDISKNKKTLLGRKPKVLPDYPKNLCEYIQFLPENGQNFTYLMLTNLGHQWLDKNTQCPQEGKNILNEFKNLPPRQMRELIWKTTTPQHGNLFERIHFRVKRLERERNLQIYQNSFLD